MKTSSLLLATLLAFPCLIRAADATGTWKAEFDTQIGLQKYTFSLKQEGTNVTGKASSEIDGEKREVDLKEGTAIGDTVSFVEMLNFQGNELRIVYQGKVSGNEIKLTRNVAEIATEELTAKREAPAVPAQPVLKETFQEQFLVGTAINRTIATSTPNRGGAGRSQELIDKDVALTKQQFNQISPENDLKWQLVHPREGGDGYNFVPADAYVNFGLSNNLYVVGHTLVWHSQTPNWVFAGTNPPPAVTNAAPVAAAPAVAANAATTNAPARGRAGGAGAGFVGGRGGFTGPRASREELLERMRDHIHTVVGRYQGKVKTWDVVNEAVSDNNNSPDLLRSTLWLEIIGPDFIAKAFQYAHEADPDAILRYNDFGLENPVKRQKLITLIKSLLEQKVPVMAIGTQAHLNVSTSFEIMDRELTELEILGLPIHVTELDVNGAAGGQRGTSADVGGNAALTQGGLVDDANQRQSEAYAGLFRAFMKHKNSIDVVTFWGVNDAVSWRAQGRPLLFDGNDQPKPAFDAVVAEARKATSAK